MTAAPAVISQRTERWHRSLTPLAWIGMVFVVAVVLIAVVGPYFAPGQPDETVGSAYASPSDGHPLGLDYLGRDVLSRFLWGGRTALVLATLIVLIAYLIGLTVGLVSAYVGGWLDNLLMRGVDLLLAFPSIVLILLVVTAFGSSLTLLVVAAGITSAPRTTRVIRGAALPIVGLAYVEAARARGEGTAYILSREILPNIRSPILVDFGIRFTHSILLVAAISFLGLGLRPPAADWGLMVAENRAGITVQPWPIVAPIMALGLLAIGMNLVIDGYRGARPPGR